MPVFDKYDNAITRICQEYGRTELVKKVFQEAKSANPDSTLLLNDFNTSDKYAELIDECLGAGAPIDVIGIQSHQHQGYWGSEKLYDVLDRFSRFGKPIHFTENTLISGDIMPAHIVDLNDWQVDEWPSTPEGEDRQMKEWEEMYRILFEHPLVEAITGWDFTDGMWLGAPSGIVRKDNTIKPSFTRLKELIKGEWWTDTTITTDENGYVTAEGFKGEYDICLGDTKASIALDTSSEDVTNITLK
jgi:GH35 family endo-1,4-beta-xylanase